MITKTELAKKATSFVVGATTGNLVRQIIKNNVAPDSTTDKAAAIIGSYVLGAIIADKAKAWTDAEIDKLIAWVKSLSEGISKE